MENPTSHAIVSSDTPNDMKCTHIDFPQQAGIREYEGHFAAVIDNAFSPVECAALLRLAEARSLDELNLFETNAPKNTKEPKSPWVPAAVYSIGSGEEQIVRPSYRNSGRIVIDDHVIAESIFHRLRPHLEEVSGLGPFYSVGLLANRSRQDNLLRKKEKPLWRLKGINERLRFLKYEPGQFFKRRYLILTN